MEATQNAGRILMDSLQLLGVAAATASREYGCTLSNDMFVQPNQKGFNAVLHLLFDRIKGREAFRKLEVVRLQLVNGNPDWYTIEQLFYLPLRKDIKGAWPVKDSVNQREYNKIMQRYIMELTQTGHVPKHLSVHLPQGFRQLSGSRLTALLCYVAAYALSKDQHGTDTQGRSVTSELPGSGAALEPLYKSVRAQNARQRATFVEGLTSSAQAQASWVQAAETLSNSYRVARQASAAFVGQDDVHAGRQDSSPLDSAAGTPAVSSQEELLEAAAQAEFEWSQLEAGAAKQKELDDTLDASVTQAMHPHVIDGAALWASMFGKEASSDPVVVSLPSLLEDWRALLGETQSVLLEECEVQRLEAQGRPVVPLLASEQQLQVAGASGQQEARLHAQKQLSAALQTLLSSAVAQREALSWRLNGLLGLANPTVPCPRSPLKDLIPALYPDGKASLRAEGIMSQASMPNATKTTGAHLVRAQNHGKGLLERENIRAQLELPAYPPTAFEGSLRPLQLYIANAPPTILESTGPTTTFASSFIPTSTLALTGVEAVRKETREKVQQLQGPQPESFSAEAVPPIAAVQKCPEPRKLSFSGTTPGHLNIQDGPSPLKNATEKAVAPNVDAPATTAGPSLDDLMSRMERLRADS